MESASLEPKPVRRGKLKKQLPSVLFLTPFTVFFLMFTVVPILAAIVLSFTYFNMVSTPTFVGFDNYIRLFFNDDVFLIALKNTAISKGLQAGCRGIRSKLPSRVSRYSR